MSESIEVLQKKLEEFKLTPEGIAKGLRIDLAGIAWRRMLELDWSRAELAIRAKWSTEQVRAFLDAEESTVGEIAVIMHAMGLQITYATRPKSPQPQPTDEQKDRPEPTPFQEYMDELPDLSNRFYDKEAARHLWNRACKRMKEHLWKDVPSELNASAFYAVVDRTFAAVAEPKPTGEDPDLW